MAAPLPRYEPFEHTAEAGIIARGGSLAEAFANTAEGMYALMLDLETVAEREEREIALDGQSTEQLLIDWLLELIFLTETEDMVFRRFQIDELSESRLRARAWGERFDTERHRSYNVMVKAVTQHLLEIVREGSGYRIRVLFDI